MSETLAAYAPTKLQSLKDEFPEHARLFETGIELGEDGTDRDSDVISILAKEALSEAGKRVDQLVNKYATRAKSAARVRLFSNILSVIASAGLIGALSIGEETAAIVIATVLLLSNLFGIYAEYLSSGLTKNAGPANVLEKLASIKAGLVLSEGELKLAELQKPEANASSKIFNLANKHLAELRHLEVTLGHV